MRRAILKPPPHPGLWETCLEGTHRGHLSTRLLPADLCPRTALHSAAVAYENLSCLQAKETTVGTPRGIFDPPLLYVLHRPGTGFPVSPWAPRAVGNLSRQTSAAPQPCTSADLPQPFSYMRPSRSRGLFPLCLAGKRAHRDEGLPACSALGGQHVSVRNSSLCVSNNTEPCSLENPAKAAAVPRRSASCWFRAQGVSGASSLRLWLEEGGTERQRRCPHRVAGQGCGRARRRRLLLWC